MSGCIIKLQTQDLSVSTENLSLFPRNRGSYCQWFFLKIIPVRWTDYFMSVNYLGEKEKKKTNQNPPPTTEPSRTFKQITAKTWIPIHVSLQSCKKNFVLQQFFCLDRNSEDRECSLFCLFCLTFYVRWGEQTIGSSDLTAHEMFITTLRDRPWIPPRYLCFTSLTQERRYCLHLATAAKVALQHALVHLPDWRDTLMAGQSLK